MSANMNRVTLLGEVASEMDITLLGGGMRKCAFRMTTKEKDTAGRERVQWHRIVVFDWFLVDLAEERLRVGSPVLIEGALQSRAVQVQGAEDREIMEVVLRRSVSRLIADPVSVP